MDFEALAARISLELEPCLEQDGKYRDRLKRETEIVDKPWGSEKIWALTEQYAAKIITINDGEELSLQYHEIKDETIYVLAGNLEYMFVSSDSEFVQVQILHEGAVVSLPSGVMHKFSAVDGNVTLLEVSTPELDDVVRIDDKYGRCDPIEEEPIEEEGPEAIQRLKELSAILPDELRLRVALRTEDALDEGNGMSPTKLKMLKELSDKLPDDLQECCRIVITITNERGGK